jgi:hypothetical protein
MMGLDAFWSGKKVACTRKVYTVHYDGNTGYDNITPGLWDTDQQYAGHALEHAKG